MYLLRDLSKFTQLYLHLIFHSKTERHENTLKIKNWMRIVRFLRRVLWENNKKKKHRKKGFISSSSSYSCTLFFRIAIFLSFWLRSTLFGWIMQRTKYGDKGKKKKRNIKNNNPYKMLLYALLLFVVFLFLRSDEM